MACFMEVKEGSWCYVMLDTVNVTPFIDYMFTYFPFVF